MKELKDAFKVALITLAIFGAMNLVFNRAFASEYTQHVRYMYAENLHRKVPKRVILPIVRKNVNDRMRRRRAVIKRAIRKYRLEVEELRRVIR